MRLTDLSVSYEQKKVYDHFSISFATGKTTCVLGASGCGKTTLLNVIAGIIPHTGSVERESDRIAYIFQTPVLLQHLTVYQNVDLVLKRRLRDKTLRKQTVEDALKKVGLWEERRSYPSSLSGGMAQRLDLARAYACDSDIILLDEPFHALDVSLKKEMIDLFRSLFITKKTTSILVTHDVDEAILLADSIVILGKNKVLFSVDLPERTEPSVEDFPDIRKKIYDIL